MSKTKKITMVLLSNLVAIVALFSACVSTGNPDEDVVITRIENVEPDVIAQVQANPSQENPPVIIIDVENMDAQLPNPFLQSMVEKFMPDAKVIAVTERQFLKPEFKSTKDLSQVINLTIPSVVNPDTGEPEVDTTQVVTTLTGIVGTIFPPAAPFVPLLGLLPWLARKRSRQHLGDAVKKATPYDGTIDIAGAWESTAKAFGWSHSTEDPEDLERLAKKKRVAAAAKNGELEKVHEALVSTK